MKTLLIILITLLSLQSYSQSNGLIKKEIELRKARCIISATTIPMLVSAGLGMYLLTTNDKAIAAIPLINMTFFFGASVKAFNDKNKIQRKIRKL